MYKLRPKIQVYLFKIISFKSISPTLQDRDSCSWLKLSRYQHLFLWLSKKFWDGPTCLIGGRCADDKPYAPSFRVSQDKAKSLGIHFTPLEVSLKDTVESLKEKNLSVFDSWYLLASHANKS